MAQPGGGPAPVGATKAIHHQIQETVKVTGVIRPGDLTDLASEVEGRVSNVFVKPGSRFQKGDVILELDRTLLEMERAAASASMNEAEANLKLATAQQERSANMFKEELISPDDHDSYTTRRTAALARFEQAKAVFDQLEYKYERSRIVAPYDGFLSEQHVFLGDWVQKGERVVTCLSTERAEVWAQIPEMHFSNELAGKHVGIQFPHNPNLEIEGTIRNLVPLADDQTHTFPVVIDLPFSDAFGLGMMVRTEIPIGKPKSATMVPKDAISYSGDQATVWIVAEGGALQSVAVSTGLSSGAWIEVKGEVNVNDQVITRGNERIFPGMTVQPEAVEYELP